MARVFVTGGAGFIGSNLVDRLLSQEHTVIAYDNLSTGHSRFLASAQNSPRFQLVIGDLLDKEKLSTAMSGSDIVYHFAANADVRFGVNHPEKDLQQNTLATFNVLEAMRGHGISRIAFSSTGAVYGESKVVPTPEDAPFPVQTSLYGASKVACEGLISSYCEGFSFTAWIFRFVAVLGERYTHGHVFDFYKKLRHDPTLLHVLGNGRQRKSYMYIQDCIDAIDLAVRHTKSGCEIYNLGIDGTNQVNDSIACITKHLGLTPTLTYAGGDRGWIGDNPLVHLDTQKIRRLGWTPKMSIEDAIRRTLGWLQANEWVFAARQDS